MNIVTSNQTDELDLSFSREKFDQIEIHTCDLIANAQPWKSPQEAFESDFDAEEEPPYVEFMKFKTKWYELGEEISLERKIERFNDWIRLNKVMQGGGKN